MRTTKAQVEGIFKRLAEESGKRIASTYNDVGAWQLNYVAEYGGYQIEEILSERGSCQPISDYRMKAGEFWNACHFALRVLEQRKAGDRGEGYEFNRRNADLKEVDPDELAGGAA